ncbi:hypothetical protein OF83DRAFT_510200 [Amylostereum chailletii]|nr:hypothetical protein OF83DRAFT_510200 [Amylostereum chailletii]
MPLLWATKMCSILWYSFAAAEVILPRCKEAPLEIAVYDYPDLQDRDALHQFWLRHLGRAQHLVVVLSEKTYINAWASALSKHEFPFLKTLAFDLLDCEAEKGVPQFVQILDGSIPPPSAPKLQDLRLDGVFIPWNTASLTEVYIERHPYMPLQAIPKASQFLDFLSQNPYLKSLRTSMVPGFPGSQSKDTVIIDLPYLDELMLCDDDLAPCLSLFQRINMPSTASISITLKRWACVTVDAHVPDMRTFTEALSAHISKADCLRSLSIVENEEFLAFRLASDLCFNAPEQGMFHDYTPRSYSTVELAIDAESVGWSQVPSRCCSLEILNVLRARIDLSGLEALSLRSVEVSSEGRLFSQEQEEWVSALCTLKSVHTLALQQAACDDPVFMGAFCSPPHAVIGMSYPQSPLVLPKLRTLRLKVDSSERDPFSPEGALASSLMHRTVMGQIMRKVELDIRDTAKSVEEVRAMILRADRWIAAENLRPCLPEGCEVYLWGVLIDQWQSGCDRPTLTEVALSQFGYSRERRMLLYGAL